MIAEQWLLCPVCGNKTRVKIRGDTILENFPLFCPKCKQETLINVRARRRVDKLASKRSLSALRLKRLAL